jgi:hypothetical protein
MAAAADLTAAAGAKMGIMGFMGVMGFMGEWRQ